MKDDFSDFMPKDISKVKIDTTLTLRDKKARYMKEIGNANIHKVGNVTVKCEYGSVTLNKMLSELIYD